MYQQISTAIAKGKSDEQILAQMANTYGNDILLTSIFRGFDTLLWIVLITGAVVAAGLTLAAQPRRKIAST